MSATLDEPTPVFQRGGTIVPTLQRVRRSTKIMMNDPYTLIVALDENGRAKGHIYIDDGQSFKVSNHKNIGLTPNKRNDKNLFKPRLSISNYFIYDFSFQYQKGANLYIELTFEKGSLHGSMVHEPGYKSGAWLERVIIYGYPSDTPKSVKVKSVSGGETELDSSLHSDTKTLVIKRPGISLSEDGWSISLH